MMNEKEPAKAATLTGTQNESNSEKAIPQQPQTGKNVWPPELSQTPESLPWPSSFKIAADGVYRTQPQEGDTPVDAWICSPLVIAAYTRDENERGWSLLLYIKTRSGKWHQCVLPMQLLGGNSNAYREILLDLGLCIAPGAHKDLHLYLATAKPARIMRQVDSTGWQQGGGFIHPLGIIGPEEIRNSLFLKQQTQDNLFKRSGSVGDWQKEVGIYCRGNSRLIFAVSAAFAAPLLRLSGFEGFGFHFTGNSSVGKSTLLLVAGSVCGGGGLNGFIRRWRVTDNALESIAMAHNDSLLCLDEIGQVEPKAIADISYMLANGQGKARSSKDGIARSIPEWRLLLLSSGELSIEQKLLEDGRRFMAGQEVRLVSIPADAGSGLGIFEDLHNHSDGRCFSDALKYQAVTNYGTPFIAFLRKIADDGRDSVKRATRWRLDFEKHAVPDSAHGQVKRIAGNFALVAAAGELAFEFGIVPWKRGAAFAATLRCFQDWLATRDGLNASEMRQIIERVRAFIARHGSSRFVNLDRAGEQVVPNCAGYRKTDGNTALYLFDKSVFRHEVCAGFDHNLAAKYLLEAGLLEPRGDGRFYKNYSIKGIGKCVSLYTVSAEILGDTQNSESLIQEKERERGNEVLVL